MIFKLKGKIESCQDNTIIFEVNNIFYKILFQSNKIKELRLNENLQIYITEIIKEDDYTMFGFSTIDEKIWFENLIKIDGLGPKIALKLMSSFSIDEIKNIIANKDNKSLETVSGIGSKIAVRLANEMNKKIIKVESEILLFNNEIRLQTNENGINYSNNINNSLVINFAIEGLKSLGFNSSNLKDKVLNIKKSLENEMKDTDITSELIIQKFLKDFK